MHQHAKEAAAVCLYMRCAAGWVEAHKRLFPGTAALKQQVTLLVSLGVLLAGQVLTQGLCSWTRG